MLDDKDEFENIWQIRLELMVRDTAYVLQMSKSLRLQKAIALHCRSVQRWMLDRSPEIDRFLEEERTHAR
jgi:hypothetical protein